jgi:hypothetical protein
MRTKTFRRALAATLFTGSFVVGCEMALDFDRTPLQTEDQRQKDAATADTSADGAKPADGGGDAREAGDAGRDATPGQDAGQDADASDGSDA